MLAQQVDQPQGRLPVAAVGFDEQGDSPLGLDRTEHLVHGLHVVAAD